MNRTLPVMSATVRQSLSAYVKLLRAAETVASRTTSHFVNIDLTTSQFGVLEALLHLGPLTQKQLGGKILKTSGNMTLVIDNLEKRGLVRRVRHEEDRRSYVIYLTPQGEALIRSIFPMHAEAIHNTMSVLSQDEMRTLAILLKKLGRADGANTREGGGEGDE